MNYPVGSIVKHRVEDKFGYGIIVDRYDGNLSIEFGSNILESGIVLVMWHGGEDVDIQVKDTISQIHYSDELILLNTKVGIA